MKSKDVMPNHGFKIVVTNEAGKEINSYYADTWEDVQRTVNSIMPHLKVGGILQFYYHNIPLIKLGE